MIGLLVGKDDLGVRIGAAIQQGRSIIEVELLASSVSICIEGSAEKYSVSYSLCGTDDKTTQIH